jgi:predicted Zn finger-like uncharacterized protein
MARLTATFTCPKCQAVYQCEVQDYIAWDRQEFRCQHCGNIVHSWSGTRDYASFRLVKEPDRT